MPKAPGDLIRLPHGWRRRRHLARRILPVLVIAVVALAPFGAEQAAMSTVGYVVPAEPAPDPGGGADPAPSPPQAEVSGPSDGGDSGSGGDGGGAAPVPEKSRPDAQADSGAADAAQAPPAEPAATSPGAGGAGPPAEQPTVQGPGVTSATPPSGTTPAPQVGAAAPVPAGAPPPAEANQSGVTAPPPGAQPPNSTQPAAVGSGQVAPAGTPGQTPTTNAVLNGTTPPGMVSAASTNLAPETTQTCMGGSGCQAKPMALAADSMSVMPPRKEIAPIIIGAGIAAGEGTAAWTTVAGGAAALGVAAAAAYDWLTSDSSADLTKPLFGGDEVYNITDPGAPQQPNDGYVAGSAAQPATPNATTPGNGAAPPRAATPGNAAGGSQSTAPPQVAAPGPNPSTEAGNGATAAAGSPTASGEVLPTPQVENPKLKNIVRDLYRGTTSPDRVGTGTTADALRNEKATGDATGGKYHTEKANVYSRALRRVLRDRSLSESDRRVAQSLYDDLQNALGR